MTETTAFLRQVLTVIVLRRMMPEQNAYNIHC